MNTYGPGEARCEVLVLREGLLSAVGHDLLLRVTAFELAVDPRLPAVSARFDASSLRVVTAMRAGLPLPGALRPEDVRDIEGTIARTVLRAHRYPEIRFTSTAVRRLAGGYELQGELALAGVTRSVAFAVLREGDRLATQLPVHQPSFGIRPHRALLGALRVRPDVLVSLSVPGEGL